ncbi:MAG: pantoate--beta-alanine ligase [Anaerolineae bacterium]|nr:pantoate--beta-alanine ligase [Anaerolineae bacterium]
MQIVETIADLRTARRELPGRIGLVPTMGYLHEGHLSLAQAAREDCDSVLATIFVNPTQFAEGEDLSTYPRDMPRDLQLLEDAGVYLVFTPTPELMYPPRFQTWVTVEEVTQGKEGGQRPGHFRGVATIVSKLFNLTQPDVAYFGQKDAQQVVTIRQMVRDLNFPLDIVVCPVIRAEDGLALSSRNVYLSAEERRAATALNRALKAAGERYAAGERDPGTLRQAAADILAAEPLARVDYISVADAATLAEISQPTENPLLISLAAQVGKPRLLDNCLLPLSLNTREGATLALGG